MHLPQGYSSDSDLLRALQGSATRERAFRDVIQAWQKPLYGHLIRMLGNHEDAADALQESLVKFVRKLGDFKGESQLYSWLHSIASRTAIDALRKRNSDRNRWGDVALGKHEHNPDGVPLALDREDCDAWNDWHGHDAWNEELAMRQLMSAVMSLPDRQRAVFVLRYFQAMPYREMSKFMGVTESTLKALYHHAQVKLVKALSTS